MDLEFDMRLRKCPFCGADAWFSLIRYDDGDVYYNPQCSECLCGVEGSKMNSCPFCKKQFGICVCCR